VTNPTTSWFITGTDTDVGKTIVATALLDWLSQQGTACGYKPVAAGCECVDGQLKNSDALALQAASRPKPNYSLVNPVALAEPIAPHIAAANKSTVINVGELTQQARDIEKDYQYLVVEGAGGWMVPLNKMQSFADLAVDIGFPVILVVGIRLGCINHALLTASAIKNSGLHLAGWVANCLHPEMPALLENINSIKQRLDAPLLGVLPKLDKPDTATIQQHINFQTLVS
jgi:dethiobiotin synthetase